VIADDLIPPECPMFAKRRANQSAQAGQPSQPSQPMQAGLPAAAPANPFQPAGAAAQSSVAQAVKEPSRCPLHRFGRAGLFGAKWSTTLFVLCGIKCVLIYTVLPTVAGGWIASHTLGGWWSWAGIHSSSMPDCPIPLGTAHASQPAAASPIEEPVSGDPLAAQAAAQPAPARVAAGR
jgi:hypothetical protein